MSKPLVVTVTNTNSESKPTLLAMKGGQSVDPDLIKIRDMWIGGNAQDREIAMGWLTEKLKSKVGAAANILLLYLTYRMQDEDGNEKTKFSMKDGYCFEKYALDEQNYFEMSFETYPIYFGKDYRYRFRFDFTLEGERIVDEMNDYSRNKVGEDEPIYDFSVWVLGKLIENKKIPRIVWLNGTIDYPQPQ